MIFFYLKPNNKKSFRKKNKKQRMKHINIYILLIKEKKEATLHVPGKSPSPVLMQPATA